MSDSSRRQNDDPFDQASEPAATQPGRVLLSRHWLVAGTALIVLAACATPSPVDSPISESSRDTASHASSEDEPDIEAMPLRKDADADRDQGLSPATGLGDTEKDDKTSTAPVAPAKSEPVEAQPDLPAAEPPTTEQPPKRIEPEADLPDMSPEAPATELEAPERKAPETEGIEADRRSAASPSTQELSGHIRILQNGREQAFASMHLSQTVVAWMPDQPVAVDPMPERRMITRQRLFFPHTLVLTSGTPVRFPNMDSIDHNVFSLTPDHRFDVGRYGESEGRIHVFEGSGVVEILCNLHANMRAYVLVLETPFFATPDEAGRFSFNDLPDGPGKLLVWNYRASEQVQQLVLDPARHADLIHVDVDITRSAIQQRRGN